METLVVNLFGGPSVGKSTTSSLVFGKLKNLGINAEYVTEFAKDLVWEERFSALQFQPYVTAKQMWRLFRLKGKVEVIVTDSPILFGVVYSGDGVTPSFCSYVVEVFNTFNNFNILLKRDSRVHAWNPKGRQQSEEEATYVDSVVRNMLQTNAIPHEEIAIQTGELTANHIVQMVLNRLG